MTLIRIGYAFRIRVNEREKIVYDKLFQHHLSPGQATATQTTWPGLLLCSSCWPLTPSLQKGCLNCIPCTSPMKTSFKHVLLWFSAYVTNCTTNRHSLIFLRWEKDKDNTVTEQKTSSSGLLPRSSMSLCHRKLRYQQVLPGSPSKILSANTAFLAYVTLYALYSQFTLQTPKHFVFLSKGVKSLQSLSAS